ncbi:histone-lysine N-methyltransferase SETD5-like isoform X7 [Carassius gibelio]|nr:histone-lysine N-methyltransferase SETD5-like isoform X5 [Carassius gibelio]XP_052397672.1 histone-lysine N-methyltransferase SETD5-like isoform X6 [Carassius gibelio]XP_052397673.1 histone-lysine N-methyltransferase SETD5-like isoform X7 [Carassius gibelio]
MSKRKRFSPVEDATAHILSGKDKPCLEERFINSHKGRGVFASMSIDKGCFILEYRGELLSQEESQTRQNRYNETENTFLFEFDWNGRQWCIDASKEDGSLGRLVNDNNKTPNCKVKKISVEGKPHLCLFSVKAIASGEELTYNYGDSDWPWRTQLNQAVPHNEENIPSEDSTHFPDKINCPKPAEQIGSYLSEPRPSNSGQSTDHNSDHSSTASDMMENHSQVNQAVPHNEENIPSEEGTHLSDKINCPKPAEQIGSYLSEPRPSNSGQSTDHNSDHSSTASDMMENHSQVNQAVPHNEENIPLEEDICFPSNMSKKSTEQVMPCGTLTKLQLSNNFRLKENQDRCAQRYEQLSTLETKRGMTDYSQNNESE